MRLRNGSFPRFPWRFTRWEHLEVPDHPPRLGGPFYESYLTSITQYRSDKNNDNDSNSHDNSHNNDSNDDNHDNNHDDI